MSLKKIISLTMLLSMIIMTYTGIILFIAPPGRVANWSNWELFFMSKEEFANLHTTFMFLFVVATIFHVYYNFKPMLSYMKNKAKELVVFTNEMIVAFIITVIFIVGTLVSFPPFSSFLKMGDTLKNSWEKKIGTAPYAHAELSSLEEFILKMNLNEIDVQEKLKKQNIKYTMTQSLSQIAIINKISADDVYNILTKDIKKPIALTGLGKKSIEEVAITLNMSDKEFIDKLNNIGIKANKDEKFKEVCEKYDLSPKDVLEKLQLK